MSTRHHTYIPRSLCAPAYPVTRSHIHNVSIMMVQNLLRFFDASSDGDHHDYFRHPSTYYLADGNLAIPQSCGGLPAYMII